jgi:outer membrane lipoprotein-sorting protein
MFRCLAALLVVSLSCSLAAAQDVADVVKQIDKKTAAVKCFTAKFEISGKLAGAAAMKGSITFEVPNKFRMSSTLPIGNIAQQTISDGEWTYVLIPAMRSVTKINMAKVRAMLKKLGLPDKQQQHNIAKPLATLKAGTLKLTGAAKADGKNCWVIEGEAGGGTNQMKVGGVRIEVCVAVDDGLARRITTKGADGKVMMQLTYEDVEANPKLAANTFIYTPAKGVLVTDQTSQIVNLLEMMLKGANRAPEK